MIVLYKELDTYYITSEDNYKSMIRDASKVTKMVDCDSASEAISALNRWGIASPEEIINKTGETIWL